MIQPSTHPIESEHLTIEQFPTPFGICESAVGNSVADELAAVDAVAIKIPGAGGRAERSSPHPFELWEGINVRVWTINHHGYGNSEGAASLSTFSKTLDSAFEFVTTLHPDKPVFVVGNSLGCISALYLAATKPVQGLFIRNPVPVAQMIRLRPKYNWWNFGGARFIANQVPVELDAVANAGKCNCPVVLVRSERDRVVPAKFQHMIFEKFKGEKFEFVIEGARHHHKVPVHQEQEYIGAIDWLKDKTT